MIGQHQISFTVESDMAEIRRLRRTLPSYRWSSCSRGCGAKKQSRKDTIRKVRRRNKTMAKAFGRAICEEEDRRIALSLTH